MDNSPKHGIKDLFLGNTYDLQVSISLTIFEKYLFVQTVNELLKPLNVITLGHTKIANINRMITINRDFYLVNGTFEI